MSFSVYLISADKNLNAVLDFYFKSKGWECMCYHKISDLIIDTCSVPDLWIITTDEFMENVSAVIDDIKTRDNSIPIMLVPKGLDLIKQLKIFDFDDKMYDSKIDDEYRTPTKIVFQNLTLDVSRRTITDGDNEVKVTSKEFDLLEYFSLNQGFVLSREEILYQVWGSNHYGDYRLVDDLLRRVRKKFDELSIETVYGYGYRPSK